MGFLSNKDDHQKIAPIALIQKNILQVIAHSPFYVRSVESLPEVRHANRERTGRFHPAVDVCMAGHFGSAVSNK